MSTRSQTLGPVLTRRAALGAFGGVGLATALAALVPSLPSAAPRALATSAAGSIFVRDGIASVGNANVFFHRQGSQGFLPSAGTFSASPGSPWRLEGERVVATLATPASGGSLSVPGSASLTWERGAITTSGELLGVTISISNVRIEPHPALEQTAGSMDVIVGDWEEGEGFYVMSGLLLGERRTPTPVTITMDCTIEVAGAPADGAFVFYLYDLDQPVEDVRLCEGFELVHLEPNALLKEAPSTRWLRSGNQDSTSFDPRFACSALVPTSGLAAFTWRGRDCGTVLFGELGAIGESDGKKDVADLESHLAVLAYLGATLKGTQFCVMNTLVPGTPAAALNGHYVACDGTDFFGELFEVRDHLGRVVEKVGGMLALSRWAFAGTFNDELYPTAWHYEGGNPIWRDGKIVGSTPSYRVIDAWRQYYAPSISEPRRSPIVAHEALPTGTPAERVYGPKKPADYQIGTIDAGSPVEYRPGHCDSRTVVNEDYGPFSWGFTGERSNVVTARTARLHYMLFCADGAWHEVLYEGEQEGEAKGEAVSAAGERVIFGGAPCGFFAGGLPQHLPAFGDFSPIFDMCRELGPRVTDDGAWVLNDDATRIARGQLAANQAVVRVGACTYLAGDTGGLGADGFMGWHFTGGDATPPSDEVLDGWVAASGHGFVGGAEQPATSASAWASVHVEGVLEEGLGVREADGGVRSTTTCVRLEEGDNYVWGVNHATLTSSYLSPGRNGTNAGLDREHGEGSYSNEIDYDQNGVCVYDAPATGDPAGSPYDIEVPRRIDVRVGRTYRLKPFHANAFTPRDYDLARWDDRWTRWSWQGWHTRADDGRGPGVGLERRVTGDETLYTGWKVLDAEGIVTVRRLNR